ncbi:MAG TPA: ROK family protein [Acidobacteriota bacterium]|jgi:glucokinase|nr:ROK family protein [Acidobacteriota bacterium]
MSILAFESGGTKLVALLADDSGKLLQRGKALRHSGQTAAETLKELCRLGHSLLSNAPSRLRGIGYGFGGPVSRATKRPLISYSESGWDQINPVRYFEENFEVPAFIENDCNSAALGEALYGAGRGSDTVFYATLGTGCGGGLVHRGEIVALADNGEAEFGHIVLDPQGPACACGNFGCVEAFCSGPAIAAQAQTLYGGRFSDSKAVLQAFLEGDPDATVIVEEICEHLGHGLGIVATLFNPDVMIIGGGVAQTGEPLLERIRHHARRHTFGMFRDRARVVASVLGEDAVCQGAAAYAAQRLERESKA